MLESEFDQWVETGRDESMEKGHFEATMHLLRSISSSMNSSPISSSPSFHNRVALDVGCGNGWALRNSIDFGGRAGMDVTFPKDDRKKRDNMDIRI